MIASIAENRETHRNRWQQAKQTHPALALSAHQALRALEQEDKAEHAFAHLRPMTAVDAYNLCDILANLARVLEAWAYVSARLWHLCETGQADAEVKTLHTASCEHYRRLLMRHLQIQQQTFIFCEQHQVVLRFGIVTQALDVSDQLRDTNTKTGVSLQEIPAAQWGDR